MRAGVRTLNPILQGRRARKETKLKEISGGMRVIVGTTNKAKLVAVQKALVRLQTSILFSSPPNRRIRGLVRVGHELRAGGWFHFREPCR